MPRSEATFAQPRPLRPRQAGLIEFRLEPNGLRHYLHGRRLRSNETVEILQEDRSWTRCRYRTNRFPDRPTLSLYRGGQVDIGPEFIARRARTRKSAAVNRTCTTYR